MARGDLGVEMVVESVPITQRKIIDACHAYGRPVIVATQSTCRLPAPVSSRRGPSDAVSLVDAATLLFRAPCLCLPPCLPVPACLPASRQRRSARVHDRVAEPDAGGGVGRGYGSV